MRWALLSSMLVLAIGCDVSPTCDAPTLSERLSNAAPGQIVEVGDCEVRGRFVVADGAILQGTGPSSAIIADSLGPTLTLTVSEGNTSQVRALTIGTNAHAAVSASGAGGLVLSDLVVRVPAGVGVAAENLSSLQMTRVVLEGSLSSSDGVPSVAMTSEHPTHGLVVVGVANVDLRDVELSGFARFGAMFVSSGVHWEGGGVHDSGVVGVMVSGGTAELFDVVIARLWRQIEGFVISYGLVMRDGARVSTERAEIGDNEEFGVVQHGSFAEHVDLSVHDNSNVGMWVQDDGTQRPELMLMGTGSVLSRNRLAAVVLANAMTATIADVMIDDTVLGTSSPEFGAVTAGDGIQLLGGSSVALAGLRLSGNDRVQILVDLTDARPSAVTFDGVDVSGTGSEYGLIVQGSAVPDGWDSGVTRLGDTPTLDASFVGALDLLIAPGAQDIPSPPPDGVRGVIMPVD